MRSTRRKRTAAATSAMPTPTPIFPRRPRNGTGSWHAGSCGTGRQDSISPKAYHQQMEGSDADLHLLPRFRRDDGCRPTVHGYPATTRDGFLMSPLSRDAVEAARITGDSERPIMNASKLLAESLD